MNRLNVMELGRFTRADTDERNLGARGPIVAQWPDETLGPQQVRALLLDMCPSQLIRGNQMLGLIAVDLIQV